MNDHDRTAHPANALVPVDIDSTSLERLDPPTPVPADADDRPPLLRDLASRIARVMKAVRGLAHDACNTHSDYNYASADKFYQALQQPLAEAELVVRCDEVPWSLMGISLAGFNLIASALLAAGCFLLAARSRRRPA